MGMPDFAAMNGPDLVRTYNEMVMTAVDIGLEGYRPTQRFADKDVAVKRCERLHSAILARRQGLRGVDDDPQPARAPEPAAEASSAGGSPPADQAGQDAAGFTHTPRVAPPTEEEVEQMAKKQAARKAARKTAAPKKAPKPAGRLTDGSVIRLLVDGNPKKPGTQSHRIWGRCRDKMTYGKLVEVAGSRSTARAWLQWHIDHGMVAVEAPKE